MRSEARKKCSAPLPTNNRAAIPTADICENVRVQQPHIILSTRYTFRFLF